MWKVDGNSQESFPVAGWCVGEKEISNFVVKYLFG
jgi:hypothetical protein